MPSAPDVSTGRARHHRAALVLGVAVAITIVAACTPSSQDTRSTADLGLPTAELRTEPLPTAAPPTAPPVTAAPTTTPPGTTATGPVPSLAGCALLTDRHVLRARADALAVRSGSGAMLTAAADPANRYDGAAVDSLPVKALFSSTVREGSRRGQPVNVLGGATVPRRTLIFGMAYGAGSDNGVPWSDQLRFEGWPGRAWDRRLIVLDSSTCEFWEGINLQSPLENPFAFLAGTWYADKMVKWAPGAPSPRPGGSISGSGLPLLPGMVRFDEVAAGQIDHVMLATLPSAARAAYVWPATRSDGQSTDPAAPPMGSWLRLRPGVDLTALGPQARIVARALQRHGMIVSDTAPHLGIRGEPDLRWNDVDLATLEQLDLGDFEVVDASPLKVADGSWSTR